MPSFVGKCTILTPTSKTHTTKRMELEWLEAYKPIPCTEAVGFLRSTVNPRTGSRCPKVKDKSSPSQVPDNPTIPYSRYRYRQSVVKDGTSSARRHGGVSSGGRRATVALMTLLCALPLLPFVCWLLIPDSRFSL